MEVMIRRVLARVLWLFQSGGSFFSKLLDGTYGRLWIMSDNERHSKAHAVIWGVKSDELKCSESRLYT